MSSATNPAAPASVPPLTWQEWGLLASAYLSQFVASGFFYMALTAIPRERGAPLEQIDLIHMLGMVPGLKFFWVPLFDRYGFGARAATAACGWRSCRRCCWPCCALVSLLTSWQDIAADGLSCLLLGPASGALATAGHGLAPGRARVPGQQRRGDGLRAAHAHAGR